MFWNGNIYRVRLASAATQTMFEAIVLEQCAKLHNPLAEFVATLEGLSAYDRSDAVSAFIAGRRDREYPEIVRLAAQNSLMSAKYLVEHCLPDFPEEVTEENKSALLKAIQMAHADPVRAGILETRDAQRWAKEHVDG